MMPKRAVGIIRVSAVKEREGESFASPEDQRLRLTQAAQRDGLTLIEVHDELDVSGGKPLDERAGLEAETQDEAIIEAFSGLGEHGLCPREAMWI